MNSVLQPMMATPYLTDYFKNNFSKEKHHRSTKLAKTYCELLNTCRNSGGRTVTPSSLKKAVSRTVKTFSGYNQQDSQEFLRFLIDRMHDELNRVTKKAKYKELNFQNLTIEQQSDEWYNYNKLRDDSILTDLFEGQLINRTQCLSCGFSDCAFDSFMDLSVEIPSNSYRSAVSINACLQNFITPEKLLKTGFKCGKCKKKVDIQKDLTIYRFPRILVIHLKRFTGSAMRHSKLNTAIEFPEQLDMTPFSPHSRKNRN